jgi:hypothetical protein
MLGGLRWRLEPPGWVRQSRVETTQPLFERLVYNILHHNIVTSVPNSYKFGPLSLRASRIQPRDAMSATTTPILKAISEARNAHGLRLQDPARYNAYCAKRILSLKRALKFVHKPNKSPPNRVTPDLVKLDSRSPPLFPPLQ